MKSHVSYLSFDQLKRRKHMDVSYRPFVMEDFIEVLDTMKVREIDKEELRQLKSLGYM